MSRDQREAEQGGPGLLAPRAVPSNPKATAAASDFHFLYIPSEVGGVMHLVHGSVFTLARALIACFVLIPGITDMQSLHSLQPQDLP